MPNNPVTWRAQQTVNTNTAGAQSDPAITQLNNGNILVSWTTASNVAPADDTGLDVLGQIFDPLGNKVGGEFKLNYSWFLSDESQMDIAALPNGGFAVVYIDDDGSNQASVRLDRFSSTGVPDTTTNTVVAGDLAGTPFYRNPSIAVGAADSILITYEEVGASTLVFSRLYNTNTNTYGAETLQISGGTGAVEPEVTALSNGSFVITTSHGGASTGIVTRLVGSNGVGIGGPAFIANTNGNGFNDRDATVTAVSGGYVVAWTQTDSNDTDIELRFFNNGGTLLASDTLVTPAIDNNNNEPTIAAKAGGGFMVIYDDDAAGNSKVANFNAAGVLLGSFTFQTPSGLAPKAIGLGDGRVAVVQVGNNGAGEITLEFLDARDTVNSFGVYNPSQYQIGTTFGDVFTADNFSEFVHGWTGDDFITENGQARSYFGDGGNDTIIVKSVIDTDVHDGGTGTSDLIDWSQVDITNAEFNLDAGFARLGGATETMVNFENIIGTGNRDVITGRTGGSLMNGGGGGDVIAGLGGVDVIFGGAGDDILDGGAGNDTIDGGAGINDFSSYFFAPSAVTVSLFQQGVAQNTIGAGNDTLTNIEHLQGSAFNDVLLGDNNSNVLIGAAGDDVIEGGGGIDAMYGQDGFDLAAYVFAPAGVTVNLNITSGNFQDTGGAGIDLLEAFEGVAGSAFADTLIGTAGVNALFGGGGTDTINGGVGFDLLGGGAGADFFVFNTVGDSITVAPDIIVDFEVGIDKLDFRGMGLTTADRVSVLPPNGGFAIVDIDRGNNGSIDFRVILKDAPAITRADMLGVPVGAPAAEAYADAADSQLSGGYLL